MANRIIGAIPYSLGLRLKNPSEKDSEKEIVAFRQERETIDLALLAKHIKEHGSSFSKGTIYGVLQDAVECIVECLQGGYGVLLNGLGKFGISLRCSGADMDEEFSAANITGVRVTFRVRWLSCRSDAGEEGRKGSRDRWRNDSGHYALWLGRRLWLRRPWRCYALTEAPDSPSVPPF